MYKFVPSSSETGINFLTLRTLNQAFFNCLHYCDFIQKLKSSDKNEVAKSVTGL